MIAEENREIVESLRDKGIAAVWDVQPELRGTDSGPYPACTPAGTVFQWIFWIFIKLSILPKH